MSDIEINAGDIASHMPDPKNPILAILASRASEHRQRALEAYASEYLRYTSLPPNMVEFVQSSKPDGSIGLRFRPIDQPKKLVVLVWLGPNKGDITPVRIFPPGTPTEKCERYMHGLTGKYRLMEVPYWGFPEDLKGDDNAENRPG